MNSFSIGLTALRAHQQSLEILGNNVANASTPGYHRQRPELVNDVGVRVARITRMKNDSVETALLRNNSLSGYSQQSLDVATQIESILTPSETSIHANISEFFNRLEKVANAPQDMSVRAEMLSSAQELTNGFAHLDQALLELDGDTHAALEDGLAEVNRLITHIADINQQIFIARGQQKEPNDLVDQRDRLMGELAQWMEVDLATNESGKEYVIAGGGTSIIGQNGAGFQLTENSDGDLAVTQSAMHLEVPMNSGKLKALLEATNRTIPDARDRLNSFAQQVVQAVDEQHAKGLPDSGPFVSLLGTRSVGDVNAPLLYAETAFPVSKGDIYVTITENATGNRSTRKISINPATDSLSDIADQFEALTGLTSTVDTVRGTLNLSAESGYSLDFAGRVDNQPDLSLHTGSAVPSFHGTFTGGVNEQYSVEYSGAGTIGVTPNLSATIRNQSGVVIATHQVGEGYQAGTALSLENGLSFQLSSGDVNATDQASVFAVTDSDSTGLLAATGLNSFFDGVDVAGFRVRTEVFENPGNIAGTKSGITGDASNFASLAGLRDRRFGGLQQRTFVEEMADITADAGLQVQTARVQSQQAESYQQRLEADRAAVSGVDVNEEMLKIMEVERAYQAAARFITSVNATLDELFRIV